MAYIKYDFSRLEVGDSLLFTEEDAGGDLNRVRKAATRYGARKKVKLVCRASERCIRVWRVS